MPIFYALVAKTQGNVILADYTSYSGNFQSTAAQLLERITENTKKTFELDEYFFHYINEDGISVLCMADKKMNRKHCFAFLQEIKKTIIEDYTQRDLMNAKAHALPAFANVMRDKIVSLIYSSSTNRYNQEFYNSEPVGYTDKTDLLYGELNSLKESMMENLNASTERH